MLNGDPNPTIDSGTCVTCNCTVTYDEASAEDEVCIRTKPHCTKPEDEHVDWRATCLHVQRCAANAEAELRELRALIDSPRIDEFFEAVRIEAAHQVERWGVEHDAGKRSEDWITLFMYLLGKAATAHFAGNRDKLLHHIITVAAVALNWHRNATGENTRMRPGVGP
jgi:hypothetical protein